MTAEPVFGSPEPIYPTQIGLRMDPRDAARLSFELPVVPNTWLEAGDRREVLWLGPDEWLVVAGHGPAATIVAELDDALSELHRSIVDLSSNRAAIDLFGSDRLEVLSMGCGIDLHTRSWRRGACAQTLVARIPVILQEREAVTRVFVRPSHLPYLTAWFDAAVR